MPEDKIQKSILKTLSYSDIFDYPLTAFQIWKFYNGNRASTQKMIKNKLNQMVYSRLIEQEGSYYFLAQRNKLAYIRQDREKISKSKSKIAKKNVKFLSLIPTIKLIGISGSLAQNNSKTDDDIDLFIISNNNTLWITRFLVNMLLFFKNSKRKQTDKTGKDKICPNMFLTEDALFIKEERQNLFTAREIIQLKILYDKNKTYQKFLSKNAWIKKLLPNTKISRSCVLREINLKTGKIVNIVDRVFFAAQFLYMSGRITKEDVRRNVARFHPKDKSRLILQAYNLRYKSYISYLKRKQGRYPTYQGSDTRGY